MNRRIALLILAVTLITAQFNFGQDAKKDADKLQGTWIAAEFIQTGKKHPEAIGKSKVVIAGDKMTTTFGLTSASERNYTFKLDPKTNPKSMDAFTLDGPLPKGTKILGIYRFDGEQLVLCIPVQGDKRPTEFVSSAKEDLSEDNVLVTFKRVKK